MPRVHTVTHVVNVLQMNCVKCSKFFSYFTERRKRSRSLLLTLKCRFVHASHARTVMLAREALNVHLQGNWAYWWSEVEQTHLQENIFFKFNQELSYKLLFCSSAAQIHIYPLKHFSYLINIQPVSKVFGIC